MKREIWREGSIEGGWEPRREGGSIDGGSLLQISPSFWLVKACLPLTSTSPGPSVAPTFLHHHPFVAPLQQPKFNAPLFQSDLEPHWQGRESDVVIYSAVRTEGLGFVSDLQRLNVALTRARHSLFIVGNAQSLSSSEVSQID